MQRKWVSGLGILLGLWLFLSPWLLGFITTKPPLVGNDTLGGIAMIVMMVFGFFSRSGARRVSWVMLLAGVWLIMAAFVFAQGLNSAFINNVVVGMITAIIGVILMTDTRSSSQISV